MDWDGPGISTPFHLCIQQEEFIKGLTIHKAQTGEEAAAVVKNCHALLDAATAPGSAIKKERLVRFYFLTAFAEFKVANLSAAEALYLRALDIAEKSKIATSQTWEILKDLGDIYRLQGDYARAEELLQRALAIREAASDENKANVAKIDGILKEDIPTVSKDTTLSDIFPIIHDSSSPVAVIENDRLVGVLVRGAVIAALAGESEVSVNG